jgi:predicted nucleic acid-binding protein
MAVVNLGEVLYTLSNRRGSGARRLAMAQIGLWPIEIVDANLDLTLHAANLKSGQNLGYMDAFAVALAHRRQATLLATDPDFQRVRRLIDVEFLPQAPR